MFDISRPLVWKALCWSVHAGVRVVWIGRRLLSEVLLVFWFGAEVSIALVRLVIEISRIVFWWRDFIWRLGDWDVIQDMVGQPIYHLAWKH
jgi:hypothetical protein